MAQIQVIINGRAYSVSCGDGEEQRIEQLAAYVDSKIAGLKGSLGNLGDQRLLVLAALVISDELWEARETAGQPVVDQVSETRAAAIENLAGRIEALAGHLESH